jgi:hypothetical protein
MKKLWVILLTVLVFISGSVLGISSVYRVDTVTLKTNLVSQEAKQEAKNLQARLESEYDKASIFFADEKEALEIIKDYPYFRLSSFEKEYPNRIVIEVTENAETYAVEKEDGGYYILSVDGTVLAIRDLPANPLNGEENVILTGLNVSGKLGEKIGGDNCIEGILKFSECVSKNLGGIRRNEVHVEVFARAPETIFCFTMKEGVKLYISSPTIALEEKAKKAIDEYMALSNAQKMGGKLVILDGDSEILAIYSAKADF